MTSAQQDQPNRWAKFEPFLVAALNGDTPQWDEAWNAQDFLLLCRVHGVAALISDRMFNGKLTLPDQIRQQLHEILDAHKVYEILHVEQLETLFTTFSEQDVGFILLKGTALAYSVFQDPCLRSRGDTDLIINEHDRITVDNIMAGLGYEIDFKSDVQLWSYQRCYSKLDKGLMHTIDVHWRVNDRQLFAASFPWHELKKNTWTLPRLSPLANRLNPVYQLLHLCLHRTGHLTSPPLGDQITRAGDRFIWLLDIYLVSQELKGVDWNSIARLCQEKKICTIVLDSLNVVSEIFPIKVPLETSSCLALRGVGENSGRLLEGSVWVTFLVDLAELSGWKDKLTLLKEKAFPPAEHMLLKYNKRSHAWLPLLYMHRVLGFRP